MRMVASCYTRAPNEYFALVSVLVLPLRTYGSTPHVLVSVTNKGELAVFILL